MSTASVRARCRRLTVIVSDVDGVLTDGGMYYGEAGEELKKFNIRDGAGAALLKAAGLSVGAMTGESRGLITRRAEKMGLDFLLSGARYKLGTLRRHAAESGFSLEQVGYIGDEINDAHLLGHVGVFFAPADAPAEIRRRADVVLKTRGGAGALRETAEVVLRHQGRLNAALSEYLRGLESGPAGGELHVFEREQPRPVRRRKP